MEICKQGADYVELESRINKQVGFTAAGLDASGYSSRVFERADSGGPNCHDPSRVFHCPVDLCGCFGGNVVRLAMQLVVFNFLGTQWLKGSQADVQRDLGSFN